jgi:hypothetical protein
MTSTFLEDILTVFIHDVILERKEERKTIGKVLAPEHEHFEIPFWTAMPRKN